MLLCSVLPASAGQVDFSAWHEYLKPSPPWPGPQALSNQNWQTLIDTITRMWEQMHNPRKTVGGTPDGGGGCAAADGTSMERAVVIVAPDEMTGIRAEYDWLSQRLGVRNRDWKMEQQSLLSATGREYDRLDVRLADGTRRSYFFDITGFFGK